MSSAAPRLLLAAVEDLIAILPARDAEGRERIQAEPFQAIELSVHALVGGDDAEEEPGEAAP
jgi:hypothetical protein